MFWRLDAARYARSWDSGEGAFQVGGRWTPPGVRAVYAALDPATAILEVAVHKTFPVLDTVAHTLTSARIADAADVFVVQPDHITNHNWLRPGVPGAGQQRFGADLLAAHRFVVIPSAVSGHSWNVVFDPARCAGRCAGVVQEAFGLDTRLNPPARTAPHA